MKTNIIYIPIAVLILIASVIAGTSADEITATAKLGVKNGEFQLERGDTNQKFGQAATGTDYHIQVIGTTPEVITVISDVSSNGWAWIKNSSTNLERYVDITLTLRLGPAEFFIGPLHPTNAISAVVNTNTVNLECWVNED